MAAVTLPDVTALSKPQIQPCSDQTGGLATLPQQPAAGSAHSQQFIVHQIPMHLFEKFPHMDLW